MWCGGGLVVCRCAAGAVDPQVHAPWVHPSWAAEYSRRLPRVAAPRPALSRHVYSFAFTCRPATCTGLAPPSR